MINFPLGLLLRKKSKSTLNSKAAISAPSCMTTEDGMVYLSEGKSVRFGSLLMYVAKVSVLTDMSTIKLPLQLIPDLYTPRGTINFLAFLSILYLDAYPFVGTSPIGPAT